jgi:hypothetical protein
MKAPPFRHLDFASFGLLHFLFFRRQLLMEIRS